MEKTLELNTEDNHLIYWTLNYFKNKNNKLIIFVHWLFSDQNDNLYINASNYFYSNNFDTFRFDLYSERKKSRKLIETNITLNIKDLETVIKFFKDNYEEIYLIGHSLWWQAIINCDLPKISKVILWDPSAWLTKEEEKTDISYNKEKWVYIVDRGIQFAISKKFKEEWSKAIDISKYINKIPNNTSFIFAWNSSIYKNWKNYIVNYKQTIIKWADHPFTEKSIEKQLFDKTLEYLKN